MFLPFFRDLKMYGKSMIHFAIVLVFCLLSVVMVLCAPIKVQATAETNFANTPCLGCGTSATWEPITAGQIFHESGHYYLSEPISVLTEPFDVPANVQVCIHLNGNSILATNTTSAFFVSGNLTLMGSGADGEVVTYSHTTEDAGAVFVMNGGAVDLYGGTFTMNSENPVVYMDAPNSVFNVHEGATIKGNKSYPKPPVRVFDGSFNMYGGCLTDGNALGGNGGNIFATGENAIVKIAGTAKVTDGIANSGGNISVTSGAKLYISENAQISGGIAEGSAYARGGNIFVGPSAKLEMTGGKLSSGVCKAVQTKHGGGNLHIFTGGTVHLRGGTIENGSSDMLGGNVFVYHGGKLNIQSGTITGGTALTGGNVYMTVLTTATSTDNRPELHMTGGVVTSGRATDTASGYGGNIAVCGYKANTTIRPLVNISGGVIGGNVVEDADYSGCAGLGGGNLYLSYCDATISQNVAISKGCAGKYGGNIYIAASVNLTVSGGNILDGYAGRWGGNLYMAATNCSCIISGGLLTRGQAAENGGNIYANHGTLKLQGGTVSQGNAAKGANLYINMGTVSASNLATLSHDSMVAKKAPSIETGDIYVTGNMKLGAVSLAQSPIHLETTASVEVLESYDSVTSVSVESSMLSDPICGNVVKGLSAGGAYTGKLFLDVADTRYYLHYTKDSTDISAAAAGVLLSDGTYIWYADNALAVAGYSENAQYLLPAAGEVKLTGGDYRFDLCGQNIIVTGSGTVSAIDSANTGYRAAACGYAVFSDTVSYAPIFEENGRYSVALTEENGVSFHFLEVGVTTVSLRPSCAGIYYSAALKCDEQLSAFIDTCGVAVSTNDMPDADFALDGDTLWTATDPQNLESDGTFTGAMIANVLKEGKNNGVRSCIPIFGTAYVILHQNGKTVTLTGGNATISMYDILKRINDDPTVSATQLEKTKSFYSTWKDQGLNKWASDLTRIAQLAGSPYLHVRALEAGAEYASFYLYLPAGPGYYTQYRFDYVRKPIDTGLSFSGGPNDPANSKLYRVNTAYIGTLEGTVFTPVFQALQGGEIALAFRENGAGDFCGGYHGDELLTDLQMLADDEPVDLTKEAFFTFTTLRFEMTTDMYRCNTPDVKLAKHTQCYTVSNDVLKLSHKLEWLTDAKKMQAVYVPMLTARRLDPQNQYRILSDTVEFYDVPGGEVISVFDTTPYGKTNGSLFSETVLSNLASTAVMVYGEESGFSAEAGYTVNNNSIPENQLATSLIIRYSSSLDNKVYFNIGKDTQPTAGTIWELDSYYRITYNPET